MEDISKIFGVQQIEADKEKTLKAIDEVVSKIAEASTKALNFKIDVSGVTNINEWQKNVQNASNTIVDLQGNLVKLGNATREVNELEARAAALKAQHNGSTKDLVGVMKQLEQVEVQSAKAKVEDAKAAKENAAATLNLSKAKKEEAKASTENAKAKLVEAKYTAELEKAIERTTKARDAELKKIEKQQSAYAQLSAEHRNEEKAAKDLGAQYFRLEQQLEKLNEELRIDTNAGKNTDQLKGRIHGLTVEMENLGVRAKAAEASTNKLRAGLDAIDHSIGNHQRNVDNYNGAVMAMGQILREAPSFAYSFSTGLLGISNNIPILVDEINKLRAANELLKASGQATIPVWKTLLSALTSPTGLITIATAAVTIFAARMAMAGNETKKATDRLEQYNQALKDYAKIQEDMPTNIASGIGIDTADEEANLQIMIDATKSIEARTDAYNKLKSAMPGLFNGMTEEEALNIKNANAINKHAQEIIKLQKNIEEVTKARNASIRLLEQEKESQTALERTYSGTLLDPNKEKTGRMEQHTKDIQNYNIQLRDLKANLADINSPELKEKKKKKEPKDNAKELQAELELENERYKLKVAENEKEYELSNKTLYEQQVLQEQNLKAAEEHAKASLEIIKKWHGKVGESEDKYKERQLQTTRELTEKEAGFWKAIDDILKTIADRKAKADEESRSMIERWQKAAYEIRKTYEEINAIAEKSTSHHVYASGLAPLLEGLGLGGNDLGQRIKERNISKEAHKNNIYDLEDQRSGATSEDDVLAFDLKIAQEKKSIAQLEADNQKDIDDKIIEGKKKLGQQTIELAKQTIAALNQMQQQEFQREQNQIQREQETLRNDTDQKLRAIDATTGYAIDKANEKQAVLAQAQAKEAELQARSNALQLKAAKAQKQAAEASIVANTAVAIIKAFADFPYPVAIPIAALIAATGAVQYAAAASAPLPEFAKGGTTQTEHFRAGEKGAELMVSPSGKMSIAEKDGIYKAPIGTRIHTADETSRILRQAAGRMFSAEPILNPVSDNGAIVKEVAKIIGNKFEDVGDDMVRAMYGSRPQIPNNTQAYVDAVRTQQNLQFRVKR